MAVCAWLQMYMHVCMCTCACLHGHLLGVCECVRLLRVSMFGCLLCVLLYVLYFCSVCRCSHYLGVFIPFPWLSMDYARAFILFCSVCTCDCFAPVIVLNVVRHVCCFVCTRAIVYFVVCVNKSSAIFEIEFIYDYAYLFFFCGQKEKADTT